MTDPPSPSRRTAQAIDALRHGWPIRIGDGPVLLPVETAIATDARARTMLISSARAGTLRLTNQRKAAQGTDPVLIETATKIGQNEALAIADPSLDLRHPLKGPFLAQDLPWATDGALALELARLAGILPAFMVDAENSGEYQRVERGDLRAWSDPEHLAIAVRAQLPLAHHEHTEIIAFRSIDDAREHVALVIGQANSGKPPLVRLHSECLTGDIFGSLKCDCGPQLDAAFAAMHTEAARGGWGVLLYMRQEGRGIGLINKLRAYRLQDDGFDTLEANRRLGLPEEARDFPLAARMLSMLNIAQVRLLTNNPAKLAALKEAGVRVLERVPHQLPGNPHNARYLATKRDKAGHLLL